MIKQNLKIQTNKFFMLRNVFSLLLFFSMWISFSQAIPPIIKYDIQKSGAGNQNWMISQDSQGKIYSANNKGLLTFNGSQWELNPSPNESIIRSVKVIGDRIYIGTYMDFGYWENTEIGNLKYTSLSKRLDINILEDEQFWNIIDYNDKIIFQSLSRFIIIEKDSIEVQFLEAGGTLLKSYKVDNQIFYQVSGRGLIEIRNGKPYLLCQDERLKNQVIIGLFKIKGELLILTDKSGFFYLKGNKIVKWKIKGDFIFKNHKLYSAIMLSDGSFALGTISDGLIWLDKSGKMILKLNKTNGISNNTILSVFEDKNHNIWLGLDNGIDCVNADSPFLEFNDFFGKIGAVYTSIIYENNFYLGTNHGLFIKNNKASSGFSLINGTEGQVWTLDVIDGQLLCGHDLGTFYIDSNTAIKIADKPGTWIFKKHPTDNSILLQGNYKGIFVLNKINNNWRIRNKLKGFDISSRFIEFVNDSLILVSHEYKGVFSLKTDAELTIVKEKGLEESVKKGNNASMASFDSEIFYNNPDGVFRYDKQDFRFFKDLALSNEIEVSNYLSGKMINDDNGNFWMFSNSKIHYLFKDIFSDEFKFKSFYFEKNTANNVLGFEHVAKHKGSKYLLGSNTGYLLVDLGKIKKARPIVSFEKIRVTDKSNDQTYLPLNQELTLNTENNNIKFFISSFNYQKYDKVMYQLMLVGFDQDWRPWTSSAGLALNNLPTGEYFLKARTKVRNEISKSISSKKISILPPWYFSNGMYFIYFILFLASIFLVNMIFDFYYKRKRNKIIKVNARKLQLVELANDRALMEVRNEQLQKDIESKNREIAIATMSTIKRNDFLNEIKRNLKELDGDPKVKKLIKGINKNLKSNDDWEFFENAFNNADRDFLRKIKEIHPSLTHNDLRLCAFLRLSLLSKEIAPLLNISVRSVEIKRYRLRKKMSLNREQNIVDYIMTL